MRRKIVQIATSDEPNESETLYALCEDGAVFWTGTLGDQWQLVGPIPQDPVAETPPSKLQERHMPKLKTSHEIRTIPDGIGLNLFCPQCEDQGYPCLHHTGVTIYDCAEDAGHTIETRVSHGATAVAVVPSAGSSNPSDRRDGLAIQFWCEHCHGVSELTLAQHKGSTFLRWRFDPSTKVKPEDMR